MAPPLGTVIDPNTSLTALCFRIGEALLCRDTEQDSRVDAAACRALNVRSVLVVPIIKEGASCGILELFSPVPETFSESQVEAIRAIAERLMDIEPHPEYSQPESRNAGHNREEASIERMNPGFAHEKHSSQLRMMIATGLIAACVVGYGEKLRHFESHGTALLKTTKTAVGTPPAPVDQVQMSIVEDDVAHTEARIWGKVFALNLDLLRARASAGDPRAAYDLGEHYADGAGVKQDYHQAMSWFAKAATKGDASAQWKLGLGYLKGIGLQQDDVKAAAWFLRAANQAHIGAQVALSELYFDGRGVPQDYVRAYTWATIAAQTTSGGKEYLKAMAAQMTPEQLEDAERRVTVWWEHRAKPLPR
jgi:TPR repeat protein